MSSLLVKYLCHTTQFISWFPVVRKIHEKCEFGELTKQHSVCMVVLSPQSPGSTPIYSLGGGVPLGSRESYPLLYQILQIL